ncbi:MAG TPA: alpha/beta hydrolase [Myxococcaceae bacterium]|nr:alpha/beta hydrolase [Myxococcaceae bacterium]
MLKRIRTVSLEIAYEETGVAGGPPVVLLHGFPYDVRAYDGVAARLAPRCRVLVPYLRGYGSTRFLSPETMRSGQQAALGADLLAFLDALGIERAVVGGYDWGGRAACIVSALWPERVVGLVSVGGYNIQAIARAMEPHEPEAEHRFWYQFYFHSERGRRGLERNRAALCRLLWRLWSPTWRFSDEEYARSAASFESPDFVDVVIHSYRHRFGLVPGDPALETLEQRLAAQPDLVVPAVTLAGADDGVDPPKGPPARFRDLRAHHTVPGVGHNLPQEAPDAFAAAVTALL